MTHKILDEFDYKSNRINPIGVICPRIRKIAIFDFVYKQASAIHNQSAPNFIIIYMTIRSWMSVIMGVIGLEWLELFALELQK